MKNELEVLEYEDISTYGLLSYLFRTEQLKRESCRESFKNSSSSLLITRLSFLFTSFFGMTLGLESSAASLQPAPPLQTVGNPRAPGLVALFFPKSSSSLKDLDQKVAVFAGLTTLALQSLLGLVCMVRGVEKESGSGPPISTRGQYETEKIDIGGTKLNFGGRWVMKCATFTSTFP